MGEWPFEYLNDCWDVSDRLRKLGSFYDPRRNLAVRRGTNAKKSLLGWSKTRTSWHLDVV